MLCEISMFQLTEIINTSRHDRSSVKNPTKPRTAKAQRKGETLQRRQENYGSFEGHAGSLGDSHIRCRSTRLAQNYPPPPTTTTTTASRSPPPDPLHKTNQKNTPPTLLSPFLTGRIFLREPIWKYLSNCEKVYLGSKKLRSTCSGNIRPIPASDWLRAELSCG